MSALLRNLVLLSVFAFLFGCNKVNPPQEGAANTPAEASAVKALEVEEASKQLIRNWAAELNKSNLAYLDQVIHPDFVDHNPFPGVPATKAGYIATLTKAQREWFPGIQIEVRDVLAGGDKVAFRVGVKAKHVGNVMGAPGTGKDLAWEAFGIYRVKDGMLIERWELLDSFSFMSQLGLAKMAQ
ncbi:MAG: hypothetical protein A2600_12920 [Candidatus Lambdaproteobacteria bacterium RIFOXYD1_FULL_56_27]|uniref:Ester cyclase n=1 Tax=Candidatus Lambdaproteobacteria bacterium RIFOXYD2_FULL_56_26 TaxID=1817773 RepID=A0A1F6GTD8_9PROT|nr:MAG: hypothetical protein A2426_09000 [Candidatus Lambdaproteobacteria bacterium RIFOXYC1_FULL_56_13]OGH01415.1 MAG: hypothetical protein A2557_09505 [Candidatus Lambdaproteobacteria bacterium RIFOXYD2_FULL_56_26]OGH06511.1 MAG: hypothetical protein A2600_12920 [Candidatus Lambdaproteobacteria bacterium RIFOXYD1_FULL_56_27]